MWVESNQSESDLGSYNISLNGNHLAIVVRNIPATAQQFNLTTKMVAKRLQKAVTGLQKYCKRVAKGQRNASKGQK